MKSLVVFFALLLNSIVFSQGVKLTNQKLIRYYDLVNRAELKIIDNDLAAAGKHYREAFNTFKEPHGKDLYNSMVVYLKLKNYREAFKNYSILKCLQYKFEDSFFKSNFAEKFINMKVNCKVNLDIVYKNQLDSLVKLDQYYRNISGGDYAKYIKELTETDSIVANNLARLVEDKGFPNEYNIGLNETIGGFSQRFYLIILHQLVTNLYSSQKVNFSLLMNRALNEGKIAPEYAAFLFDMNNGKSQFFSKHFAINHFVYSNGTSVPLYEQATNGTAVTDCCYVTYGFFPEKRTDNITALVKQLNENRMKIGLGSIDELIKKSVFTQNNKDYKFTEMTSNGHSFDKEEDAEFLKDHMFKIN